MIKKQLSNGMGQIIVNNDNLARFKKSISRKTVVQIGVLGNKTQRSSEEKSKEKTNAEIGAIHEFGIRNEKNRMPERSFLRMPLRRNAKELFEKRQKLKEHFEKAIINGTSTDTAWLKVHQKLGVLGEQIVQKAFEQSGPGWEPLKESTIKRKKSAKILIDTAQLRRSVMSRVVKK